MNVTVYGIASCGTCKKALAWLKAQGIAHTWVDIRQSPPSKERVANWVETLGAKALRNTSGGSYRALGEEKQSWTDAEWLAAFQKDAMLIKRPVLEINDTPSAVGFKEDAYAAMLK